MNHSLFKGQTAATAAVTAVTDGEFGDAEEYAYSEAVFIYYSVRLKPGIKGHLL